MKQYSFVVFAPRDILLPEHRLVLETGRNVFNLLLADVDGFCKTLGDHGARIIQVNDLSVSEAIFPEDLLYADATPPWEAI